MQKAAVKDEKCLFTLASDPPIDYPKLPLHTYLPPIVVLSLWYDADVADHPHLASVKLVPDSVGGRVQIRGERCIEIWGNHIEEHFLITIDDQQQPMIDVIFILPTSGEYFG